MGKGFTIVVLAIAAIMIELVGFISETFAKERVYSPAFVPNADQVIFVKEDRQMRTQLVTVTISDGHITYFDGDTASLDFVQNPSVSPDGSKIVFTFYENDKDIQVGVIDVEGRNFRKLTSGAGQRIFPSFSPSGEKIVYGKGSQQKTGRISQFDLFELRLGSSRETRLSNISFAVLMNPQYFGSEDRFIFSGEAPMNVEFIIKNPTNLYDYDKKYGSNRIFLLGRNELQPENLKPFFQLNDFTSVRGASADGKVILFISRTEVYDTTSNRKKWGYDLFVRADDTNRRVTHFGDVSGGAISRDGTRVAFVAPRRATKGYGAETIWIADSEGSNLKELRLDLK